jgi:hypothetical protein
MRPHVNLRARIAAWDELCRIRDGGASWPTPGGASVSKRNTGAKSNKLYGKGIEIQKTGNSGSEAKAFWGGVSLRSDELWLDHGAGVSVVGME